MTSNHDAPPDYCYANWDEATRSRVGAETFPPTDYCNVSCAYHMGDPVRTYRRIQLAVRDGQRVCAHPGLDTAVNGRHITAEDVYTHVICQLGALKAMVEGEGGTISHVKPHGILYILLRDSPTLTRSFLKAQTSVLGFEVPLYGLAQTQHEAVATAMGVPFVAEILKDRVDFVRAPVPGRQFAQASSSRSRPRWLRNPTRMDRPEPRPRSTSMSGSTVASDTAADTSPGLSNSSTNSSPALTPLATPADTPDISPSPSPGLQSPVLRVIDEENGVAFKAPRPQRRLTSGSVLKTLHYWTMTPIPTLMENGRSGYSHPPSRTRTPSGEYQRDCEVQ